MGREDSMLVLITVKWFDLGFFKFNVICFLIQKITVLTCSFTPENHIKISMLSTLIKKGVCSQLKIK